MSAGRLSSSSKTASRVEGAERVGLLEDDRAEVGRPALSQRADERRAELRRAPAGVARAKQAAGDSASSGLRGDDELRGFRRGRRRRDAVSSTGSKSVSVSSSM